MKKKRIVIFGAGISGLSAAHELAELGHSVSLYESRSEPGGFFRSARRADGLPTEYSWHGFGPWYNNTFAVMKKTPFNQEGSVFEKSLSRPIDFGVFPARGDAGFFRSLKDIKAMFQLTWIEFIRAAWIMLKAWCADLRSQEIYSQIRAVDVWRNVLSSRGLDNWKSSFGPWVGSDWSRVSYHTAGDFFCKQLTSSAVHEHSSDPEGSAWKHKKGDGWLLLKGPSNEFWFEKWVSHLKDLGVKFHFNAELKIFEARNAAVQSALVHQKKQNESQRLKADFFVLAINPYFAKEALFNSPGMANAPELPQHYGLTQGPGHIQVSFRLCFKEPVKFPRKRMAMVLAGSEYNLTLFAQEQAWSEEVDLGKDVSSLWTGTSCIETIPGRLYGKPVLACQKEEFKREIKEQVFKCESLNNEIKKANGGKSLADFALSEIEVWPEWEFSEKGIKTPSPKWVNNANNQKFLPGQRTSLANLALAGAHTRTQADVWSIEAAVESGRLAAKAIDSRAQVIEQKRPMWIQVFRQADDFCYRKGLPHILHTLAVVFLVLGAYFIAS